MGSLIHLYHLDLTQNKIRLSTLPKTFFDLPRLERLYLSGNRIEKISGDFGKFPNLRILSVRDNQISAIHRDICRLIYLRELHLEGNQLRLLPPEIVELEELNGNYGAFHTVENPWILPIRERSTVGTNQLMEYLSSTCYKIVYDRNK